MNQSQSKLRRVKSDSSNKETSSKLVPFADVKRPKSASDLIELRRARKASSPDANAPHEQPLTSLTPSAVNAASEAVADIWDRFYARQSHPSSKSVHFVPEAKSSYPRKNTLDRDVLFAFPPPMRTLLPSLSVEATSSVSKLAPPPDATFVAPDLTWEDTFNRLFESVSKNSRYRHRKIFIYDDNEDSVSPEDSDPEGDDSTFGVTCKERLQRTLSESSSSIPFLCNENEFHKLRQTPVSTPLIGKENPLHPKTSEELRANITLSGRKLGGARDSESSEEECAFKRVRCSDDKDFDILQPYMSLGPDKGHWPNPYLFHWNWKRLAEGEGDGVDDLYIRPPASIIHEAKLKRAEVLEANPMEIPYCHLGYDDSDSSFDTEDELKEYVKTNRFNLKSLLLRFIFHKKVQQTSRKPDDDVARRYPYLNMHARTKLYLKMYHLRKIYRVHRRKLHELVLTVRSMQVILYPKTSYPFWFHVWRNFFRHPWKRVPQHWKLLKEKKTKTVFYGTLASLLCTQYISEHDVMPNMDDPVLISQIALLKALEIKEKFFVRSVHGNEYVDYIALQRSPDYQAYLESIGLLCRFQPIKMPPRVRKVFFLNYFNVLSIQTQIVRIPEVEKTKFLSEMPNFWEKTKGLAGFLELNLEEIYHGILRCNRLHPKKQVKVFKYLRKDLPTELSPTRLSLPWPDPRIHFALSVGCKSCPPIQVFSLYEHDCQLNAVAQSYVQSRVKINLRSRLVTLPILFLWYERDFGNNQRVMLCYLRRFMVSKEILKVRKLITSPKKIYFRYEPFNDRLDPHVRRHFSENCQDEIVHKRIVPQQCCGAKF